MNMFLVHYLVKNMLFWLFLLPFVNGCNLKVVKSSDIEEGKFLDTVLPPNQINDLVATPQCNQMENCYHFYMNDTGIFFLSVLLKTKDGTGISYIRSCKLPILIKIKRTVYIDGIVIIVRLYIELVTDHSYNSHCLFFR